MGIIKENMKIIIKKENLPDNPENILRRAGYHHFIDPNTKESSFSRRLGSGHYPRFHIYLKEQDGKTIIDLHLDQKQASYKGSHMHNAEYEGEVVEREIMRLKKLISDLFQANRVYSVRRG